MRYKSYRIVDGKTKWVIVDENGNIINKIPSIDELKNCTTYISERHRKYTKEQIIDMMRKFYTENGRIPTVVDFGNNPKFPSASTVQRMFGSWNDAIKDAELWDKRYNSTHTCDRCGENFNELSNTPVKEYDIKGNWTGKWDCLECWQRYDPNSLNNIQKSLRILNSNPNSGKIPFEKICYICNEKAERRERDIKGFWTGKYVCKGHYHIRYSKDYYMGKQADELKSLTQRRLGIQDPYSNHAKGDRGEELFERWKGYTNLNKKLDNYISRRDFFDEKTGEYYQIKTKYYDSISKCWAQGFKSTQTSIEQGFRFKSMFFLCISKDGKNIERIYEIPEKEIIDRGSISITINPTDAHGNSIIPWYEEYRIINDEVLKKINEIWQIINSGL